MFPVAPLYPPFAPSDSDSDDLEVLSVPEKKTVQVPVPIAPVQPTPTYAEKTTVKEREEKPSKVAEELKRVSSGWSQRGGVVHVPGGGWSSCCWLGWLVNWPGF